jgi:hypothetical protein
MIDAIKTFLCLHIDKGNVRERDLSVLQVSNTKTANGKVVFLVFKGRDRFPSWAVKVTRDPSCFPIMKERFLYLSSAGEAIPQSLRAQASVPLSCGYIGDTFLIVERYLCGTPLWTLLGKPRFLRYGRNINRALRPALEWLLTLSRETRSDMDWSLLNSLIARFADVYKDDPELVRKIDRILGSAKNYDSLPSVAVHGDFSPQNILLNGNVVNVLDWDSFIEKGCPLHDFFMFAITCGASQFRYPPVDEHRRYIRGLEYALLEENIFSQFLEWHLGQYLEEMSIRRDLVAVFLTSFLAELSIRERSTLGPMISISRDAMWERVLIHCVDNIDDIMKSIAKRPNNDARRS